MAALTQPAAAGPRLSYAERQDLVRLEKTIDRGRERFIAVSLSLREILERRLFRATHPNFDAYCRHRWGFAGGWGAKLAKAAGIVDAQEKLGLPPPASHAEALRIQEARENTASHHDSSRDGVAGGDQDGESGPASRTRRREPKERRRGAGHVTAGPGLGDQVELAASVGRQVDGHLRELESLHARHVCSANLSNLIHLLRETLLPWPAG